MFALFFGWRNQQRSVWKKATRGNGRSIINVKSGCIWNNKINIYYLRLPKIKKFGAVKRKIYIFCWYLPKKKKRKKNVFTLLSFLIIQNLWVDFSSLFFFSVSAFFVYFKQSFRIKVNNDAHDANNRVKIKERKRAFV